MSTQELIFVAFIMVPKHGVFIVKHLLGVANKVENLSQGHPRDGDPMTHRCLSNLTNSDIFFSKIPNSAISLNCFYGFIVVIIFNSLTLHISKIIDFQTRTSSAITYCGFNKLDHNQLFRFVQVFMGDILKKAYKFSHYISDQIQSYMNGISIPSGLQICKYLLKLSISFEQDCSH